jgi:hypothetical protein
MRLFFHLLDGSETVLDEEGVEVDDPNEALKVAWNAVQELIGERGAGAVQDWTLNVSDAAGTVLFSIPFDGFRH